MAYEYFSGGEKIVLEPDEDLVAVRFVEPAHYSIRSAAARKPEIDAFTNRMEVPREKYTILNVAKTPEPRRERFRRAVDAMRSENRVARVSPVFKAGNARVLATDRVRVGFKPDAADPEAFIRGMGHEILDHYRNEYTVRIGENEDPFAVCDRLFKTADVEYAEPDFVTIKRHTPRSPFSESGPDPLAGRQYAARITRAEAAWELIEGRPDIRIAILDEGVDTQHEDLAEAVAGSYDAVDDDAYQEPNPWDGHGTACAGLAAAIPGNALGIRGIGGGCSLLAARIAFSEHEDGGWISRDSWVQRAIDWAWENGADVISNSWGGGLPSTGITNAFERARTRGRGGKGCVIVVAAGNDDGPVNYPGTSPHVLTVSASNEYDEPKTKFSRDGEMWWGSNYGPEVDVAAPGVHNVTTDISGWKGYNKTAAGNYYYSFNGTSSSAPIVAGAAALMLCANPHLTEGDVRRMIAETADKVGPEPYHGGRNDRMGYGRLNVLGAVRAAMDRLPDGDGERPRPPGPEPSGLRARVTARKLNVRSGPGIQFPDIGDLYAGETVDALNLSGNDAWIRFDAGKWAAFAYNGRYMEMAGDGARTRVRVRRLIIRNGPGIHYAFVGYLHQGDYIDILDISGSDVWVEAEPTKWAAFAYLGNQYMEIVRA